MAERQGLRPRRFAPQRGSAPMALALRAVTPTAWGRFLPQTPSGFDSLFLTFFICWRLVVDARRTLELSEIQLLVKIYRNRSMGWQISLSEPINTSLPYKKDGLSKQKIS